MYVHVLDNVTIKYVQKLFVTCGVIINNLFVYMKLHLQLGAVDIKHNYIHLEAAFLRIAKNLVQTASQVK